MPFFSYQAIDPTGERVTGQLEADGLTQAADELQSRGWRVVSIGAAKLSIEQSVLQNHMDTILQSGRRLAPALRAYAEEMSAGWQRRQLFNVCRILDRGRSPDAVTALAALPECWIPLLSSAKSSHDPGQVLQEFLAESQLTDNLRQKWWLTLAYPLILISLALGIMTLLSVFILPGFAEVFRGFGLKLPRMTEITMSLGLFLASWGVPLLMVVGVLLGLLVLNSYRLLPTRPFAWVGDRLRLPYGRRTAIARFARFTADLLEAGIGMPDALRIAGYTVNKSRVRRAAWQLARTLDAQGAFIQSDYERDLTSTVTFALASRSGTTSRVRLLREISDCHAAAVRTGMSWTVGIVEPAAIGVVGLVVGCTVLALFLPLVSLVSNLSN